MPTWRQLRRKIKNPNDKCQEAYPCMQDETKCVKNKRPMACNKTQDIRKLPVEIRKSHQVIEFLQRLFAYNVQFIANICLLFMEISVSHVGCRLYSIRLPDGNIQPEVWKAFGTELAAFLNIYAMTRTLNFISRHTVIFLTATSFASSHWQKSLLIVNFFTFLSVTGSPWCDEFQTAKCLRLYYRCYIWRINSSDLTIWPESKLSFFLNAETLQIQKPWCWLNSIRCYVTHISLRKSLKRPDLRMNFF